MGFAFLNPLLAPSVNLLAFLPCHSVIPAVVLFDPYLLGLFWACCMLFFHLITVTPYCHWACIHAILGFLDPFYCLWASSAHFFLLGHSRPILILHFHMFLLTLLSFPGLITISFTFGVHELFHQSLTYLLHYFRPSLAHSCFPFHIIPVSLLLFFTRLF